MEGKTQCQVQPSHHALIIDRPEMISPTLFLQEELGYLLRFSEIIISINIKNIKIFTTNVSET